MKMRKFSQLLKISLVFGLCGLVLQAHAEMSLTNVEIKNCAMTKPVCFTVSAPQASAGNFRPIYVLKNLTLKVESPGTKAETITSPSGYLDFDNSQLVLQSKTSKGSLVETVYDLNTSERKTYTTK